MGCVTLVAATLHGAAGFGIALVATPAYLAILGVKDSVALVMIVSLALSLRLADEMRRHVDWGLLGRFLVGVALGHAGRHRALSNGERGRAAVAAGRRPRRCAHPIWRRFLKRVVGCALPRLRHPRPDDPLGLDG